MSDIYPQSPEDSHAVLSEMHPLNQRLKALERELDAANRRIVELEMALESSRAEIDISLEDCERERAWHKITQHNLRQVEQEREELLGKLRAVQAVIDIGASQPF